MRDQATIDNLPTFTGGVKFNTKLISEYLSDPDIKKVKNDVMSHDFYLANPENKNHENISFEELKKKFQFLLEGSVEKRKNSWVNSVRRHLQNNNDKAVASLIASVWRRFLGEMSLRKAQLSQYGYEINSKNKAKLYKEKEAEVLCEWCNKTIIAPLYKGFACPCCGVYFDCYAPQKIKIRKTYDEFYYEPVLEEELSICDKVRKGELSALKTQFSKAVQFTLM